MKSGKWHMADRIELSNREKLERSEKRKPTNSTWEYWKVTPSNKWRWKKKIKYEYLRRTRKLLETKLYRRNLIKEINTWAVLLVRYSRSFLEWSRELKQMDQRTRKLMTMHKALHSRDDVDRLYVSRKEGGRRLTSIEDSVDASIQRLEDYIQRCGRKLITATRNNTDNTRNNRTEITRKQKMGRKASLWTF